MSCLCTHIIVNGDIMYLFSLIHFDVLATHSYRRSIKRTISTAWMLHKIVLPPFKNFVGRLSLRPFETSYRVTSETRIQKKSTWTTRTNGRIRLDSRRLNGDRKRVGSRTRVEARPQSETNRREEGQTCQHSR